MDSKEFYRIDSKLLVSTIQTHAVGLEKVLFSDNLATEWHLILGDYLGVHFPILFQHKHGSRLQDVLDTGWPSLFLISDKMKMVLEENALTGWKVFAVKVLDKQGEEIQDYHGLSITGRWGKIDYTKSHVIEKRLVKSGPLTKYYKGLYLELGKWEVEDFFIPEDYFGIIVTKRVVDVLKKNNITNVKFERLTDMEIDCSFL